MDNNSTYKKPSLLHPEGNPYETAPGFNFTRDDFENLIDDFTPVNDIPVLLGVKDYELDKFCNYIYNMDFKPTYEVLLKRAQLYYRKAMMSLSKSGNPSAIKIASEFYVGLGKNIDDDSRFTIVNVMPSTQSDFEKKFQPNNEDNLKAKNVVDNILDKEGEAL